MKSLLILGRQPALGLAELESLYGAEAIIVIGKGGALLDIDPTDVNFERLGGSIKHARVIHILDSTKWRAVEDYLSDTILQLTTALPNGKIRLGISAYGLRVKASDINITGLRLKKIIKNDGRSVRIVPNKQPELNSAQVLHNQLTGQTGIEIVVARYGEQTVIATTVAEQDIEAYAKRDQARPARDAKVGMLPPKLAQIIVNLSAKDEGINPVSEQMVLDPFCGTGVVLQEALLMGYLVHGSDIEPRMIDYTQKNINWLSSIHGYKGALLTLEVGDATSHDWLVANIVDSIACETYLGKPFTSLPPQKLLETARSECDEIHEKFLRNIGSQIESGTRLCLAVPAWKTKTGFLHLKTLAKLEQLGYTRKKFVHVREQDLIYFREDQVVARELVVLEKK